MIYSGRILLLDYLPWQGMLIHKQNLRHISEFCLLWLTLFGCYQSVILTIYRAHCALHGALRTFLCIAITAALIQLLPPSSRI